MAKLKYIIPILIVFGIIAAFGAEKTYLFKPQPTSKAALKAVYIDTDGALKATSTTDSTYVFDYANQYAKTLALNDSTPSVKDFNFVTIPAGLDTQKVISSFDDGKVGQILYVLSLSDSTFVFKYTGGNLKCGAANVSVVKNGALCFIYSGAYWYLIAKYVVGTSY